MNGVIVSPASGADGFLFTAAAACICDALIPTTAQVKRG